MKWTAKLGLLAAMAALSACARGPFKITVNRSHVTVTPAGAVQVKNGATQAFQVTPDAEYKLVSAVTGTCPAGAWSGSTYTTGRITANCSIGFSAALKTFSVSASGFHLTVSPGGVQTVAAGSTQTFTVTPDMGYSTSTTVQGTCPPGAWNGSQYTTGAVTADCDVTFVAALDAYQVSASGTHVTIDPSAVQKVPAGASQAFTVTPETGYTTASMVGGTCPMGTWGDHLYRTGPITADCTVTFSATLNSYQVTASGDSNETITPGTSQTVGYGMTQSFTVTANHDAVLSQTVGGTCPAGSWSGDVYTTGAITADCSVTFSATTVVVVTASSDPGVTITPTGALSITPGSTQSFTVTPNAGMAASFAPGGTCPAGTWSGATYTTGPISADCSIAFTQVTPVFQPTTWTTDNNGGVTHVAGPTDSVQVTYALPATFPPWTETAQGTATTSQIVRFAWHFNATGGGGEFPSALDAFSEGPGGRTTVTLVPDVRTGDYSGTASLTLRAGDAFGFKFNGADIGSPDGTLTVSALQDAPDFLVTASGDSSVTAAPAKAVVRAGAAPVFTATPSAGNGVSPAVGGSCPPGTWSGTEYTPGPITADCTLSFSGTPGTGSVDAGVPDAGMGSRENTLSNDLAICSLLYQCVAASDPMVTSGAYAECITACQAGSQAGCNWAQMDSADGGTVDGGAADGGTVDAGTADGGTVDGGAVDAGTADGGTSGNAVVPSIMLDTDPAFYTALDWASDLWPSLPAGSLQNLSASLSIINTDETLTFDSPPALDVATGDLTFATTPGTYGAVTVLATLTGDGAPDPATFTLAVNTPPAAQNISVTFPWKSPCIPIVLDAKDPNPDDILQSALTSLPQSGFLTQYSSGDAMTPEWQHCPGDYQTTTCYVPFSSTWTGFDTFAYTVTDDHGGSSQGTVTIQVYQQ